MRATLTEELLASELFGHARGSFTGAVSDQPGRVEMAQGGTLFLDEVSEIAQGLQAKLLRFLQEKEIEIHIQPLRERPEDILPLACHFLNFFSRAAHRPLMALTKESEAALLSYPWPGNIRELRNAMERVTILWPAQTIEPQALPERIVASQLPGLRLGGDCTVEEIEREHILRVLARTKTQEEAASVLGLDTSTLWRKRRKYGSD